MLRHVALAFLLVMFAAVAVPGLIGARPGGFGWVIAWAPSGLALIAAGLVLALGVRRRLGPKTGSPSPDGAE